MKGDPRTRIGLMAQEVEDKHPKAVGLAGGFKTVDYEKATSKAANEGHFYTGGVVPMRAAKAYGGGMDPDYASILQQQQAMYQGLGGGMTTSGSPRGGKANVPAPTGSPSSLQPVHSVAPQQQTGLQNLNSLVGLANNANSLYNAVSGPSTSSPFTSDGWAQGGLVGYADGGMPYSDDNGLDIPDTKPTAKLPQQQTPQQAQSGLGQVGQLVGDAAQIASLFKGGGRVHMDDGGPPPDPSVTGDLTDGLVVSGHKDTPSLIPPTDNATQAAALDAGPPQPTGLSASPAPAQAPSQAAAPALTDTAPTGVGGGSSKTPGGSWWDRNKGNVIPALEGLAAMGTAPTKHFGVALAAGLGAGAGSYVPTQQGLASAEETRQKAIGQGLQNTITGKKIDVYNQPAPQLSSSPLPPPDTSKMSLPDAVRARNQNPPSTPEYAARLDQAINQDRLFGGTYFQEKVQKEQANLVAARDYQIKQDAQQHTDAALRTYLGSNDPKVKAQASYVFDSYYPWTGDTAEDKSGVLYNSRGSTPLIGMAAQRVSPQTKFEDVKSLVQPTDYGAPEKPPLAEVARDRSGVNLGNYVPDSMPAADGTAPAPAGGSGSRGAPPTNRQPLQTKPPSATAPTGNNASAPAIAVNGDGKQVDLSTAPNAPPYADDTKKVTTKVEDDYIKGTYGPALQELKNDYNSNAATQKDIVENKRMLNLLEHTKVGPGSETLAHVQQVLANMRVGTFEHLVDSNPDAHALLSRELAQGALGDQIQKLKKSGADVRLGQAESKIIMTILSGSTENGAPTIRAALNWKIAEDEYDLRRNPVIPKYLKAGKDPTEFPGWYSSNVEKLTDALPSAYPFASGKPPTRPGQETSGRTVVRTGTYNGKKVVQYSDGTIE
jgi:hypothetical protein